MSHDWDEFSKLLAESLPRRESLIRLGAVLAGAALSPLGVGTARAGKTDPCRTFCNCRDRKQKDQCVAICKACNDNPNRMCGSCGNYSCCASGTVCCGNYCADLEGDVSNCGACRHACGPPGPWEEAACVFGECWYQCVGGAVYCDGACTFADWDPWNCGACGNVCPTAMPYCNFGACEACPAGTTNCFGTCSHLASDSFNCGTCGVVCGDGYFCADGACRCTPDHPYWPNC